MTNLWTQQWNLNLSLNPSVSKAHGLNNYHPAMIKRGDRCGSAWCRVGAEQIFARATTKPANQEEKATLEIPFCLIKECSNSKYIIVTIKLTPKFEKREGINL